MAEKTHRTDYEKYVKDLMEFIDANGCSLKPFPKVHISNKKQDGVFIRTAYYDPESKDIYLLVNQRHIKDVLRSLAHECVHHHQNLEGNLVGYSGDTLGQDDKLDELESEAYLKGNILFRKWTETKTKSEKPEKSFTKHMKKQISLNEDIIKETLHEVLNNLINEEHLKVVDNIDEIVKFVGENWTSPDDVWWIKIEARFKDYRNYNKRNPDQPTKWWNRESRVDGTNRENHVGYVIVRGRTKEDCQNSILNAIVHLNPWAARQFGSRIITSQGNADAIINTCNFFFARAYITINRRSMSSTVKQARMDKQNPHNPFRYREFHHRVGQTRTGIDSSGRNWDAERPYGMIDCDIDDVQAQKRLEGYLASKGVKILMKRQSHDGMHYVIPSEQGRNLDFYFLNRYSTNNKAGDPNVLFKPDANIIVYSAVG